MFDFDSLEQDIKSKPKGTLSAPTKAAGAPKAKQQAKAGKEPQAARPQVSSLPEGRLPKGHRASDAPNWEAIAPAGWWRVVNQQGCWCGNTGKSFRPDVIAVNWYRRGEVIAARSIVEAPHYGEGAFMILLRDDDGYEQGMLAEGRMPRPNGELLEWGKVLELLPTGGDPPSEEVRAAHSRVVEERHAMLARVRAEETKQASISTAFTAGSPTAAFASGAASALLLRAMGDFEEPTEFERRFLDDGYFIVDNALLGGTQAFLEDMMRLDSIDSLTNNPGERQEVGPWSKRLARRTLWVDEELAKVRYEAPAVASTISLLKGLAHALSPALSRHHAARAAKGDPAHQFPISAPATKDAVLTVPPDVMVALYPGGGSKLAPHFDNLYDPRRRKRLNARELTAIIYANPSDWDAERDGGALVLYPQEEGSREPVHVQPLGGRLVVFFSCCRHEVLPCFRTRRALQLWIWRPDGGAAGGEGEGGR